MKTLLMGGLIALSVGSVAMAQDAPRGPGAADTDGDSRISQAEFVAAAVQRFDRGDANRDGTITAEEMRAGMQARHTERRGEVFARMDTNGDGSISRAEFDARPERGGDAERGGRGGGHHRGGRGRGGGGELAADGVTRAEAQARAEARFSRMDRNDDGFLTQEDRQGRGDRRRGGQD
jgi:hypothetical protein